MSFDSTTFSTMFELVVVLKVVILEQITVGLCPPYSRVTLHGGQINVVQPPVTAPG